MASDFEYLFTRTKVAGAAEAVPAVDGAIVWDMPSEDDLRVPKNADTLMVVATGAAFAYEAAFWDTSKATPAWTIFSTGTLSDAVPAHIAFPYDGARIYVRSTGVTGADVKLSVWLTNSDTASVGLLTSVLTALGTGGTLHADVATTVGGKLDTLHTDLATTLAGKLDTRNTNALLAEDRQAITGDAVANTLVQFFTATTATKVNAMAAAFNGGCFLRLSADGSDVRYIFSTSAAQTVVATAASDAGAQAATMGGLIRGGTTIDVWLPAGTWYFARLAVSDGSTVRIEKG